MLCILYTLQYHSETVHINKTITVDTQLERTKRRIYILVLPSIREFAPETVLNNTKLTSTRNVIHFLHSLNKTVIKS